MFVWVRSCYIRKLKWIKIAVNFEIVQIQRITILHTRQRQKTFFNSMVRATINANSACHASAFRKIMSMLSKWFFWMFWMHYLMTWGTQTYLFEDRFFSLYHRNVSRPHKWNEILSKFFINHVNNYKILYKIYPYQKNS